MLNVTVLWSPASQPLASVGEQLIGMSISARAPRIGRRSGVVERSDSPAKDWREFLFWSFVMLLVLGSMILLALALALARGDAGIVWGRREAVDLVIDFGFSFAALGIGIVLALLTVRTRDKEDRRIAKWSARWLAVGAIATACAYNVETHRYLEGTSWFDVIHFPFHLAAAGAYLFGLLLFPDGRVLGHSGSTTRLVVKLVLFLIVGGFTLRVLKVSEGLGILTLGITVFVVGLVSQVHRSGDMSGLLRFARLRGRLGREIITTTALDDEDGRRRAGAFALMLIFAFVLSPMLAVINLGLHGWDSQAVLDRESVLVAMVPLLVGIPAGFLLWAVLGVDRARWLALHGIPKTVIVSGYVTLAVIVDHVLRSTTALFFGLEPDGLFTSIVTTLVIVLTLEQSKEHLERRVESRLRQGEQPAAQLVEFAPEPARARWPGDSRGLSQHPFPSSKQEVSPKPRTSARSYPSRTR